MNRNQLLNHQSKLCVYGRITTLHMLHAPGAIHIFAMEPSARLPHQPCTGTHNNEDGILKYDWSGLQWNLITKRLDINLTKPSYNKVILQQGYFAGPSSLYLTLFYPDITRNLISQGNFHGPKCLIIMRFHCIRLHCSFIYRLPLSLGKYYAL